MISHACSSFFFHFIHLSEIQDTADASFVPNFLLLILDHQNFILTSEFVTIAWRPIDIGQQIECNYTVNSTGCEQENSLTTNYYTKNVTGTKVNINTNDLYDSSNKPIYLDITNGMETNGNVVCPQSRTANKISFKKGGNSIT